MANKKYKLNKLEQDKIIELYNSGYKSDDICNMYNISWYVISKILKQNNIMTNLEKKKNNIQKQNINHIMDLYNYGFTLNEIAKMYDTTRAILTKFIKSNNFEIKNYSKAAQRYTINENCFDSLNSEEASYWFGFLLADGSIDKYYTSFGFGLKYSDKDHVKKFVDFLGTNKPIKTRYITLSNNKTYKSASIGIKNKHIIEKLISYGLIPNKSTILEFPNSIPNEYLDDFMRGYIDGDGSISRDGKYISFIATPIFIDKFEQIYNVKGKRYKYNLMQTVGYNKETSAYLIKKLYYNKKIYL